MGSEMCIRDRNDRDQDSKSSNKFSKEDERQLRNLLAEIIRKCASTKDDLRSLAKDIQKNESG